MSLLSLQLQSNDSESPCLSRPFKALLSSSQLVLSAQTSLPEVEVSFGPYSALKMWKVSMVCGIKFKLITLEWKGLHNLIPT